jgi:hypothetical protein
MSATDFFYYLCEHRFLLLLWNFKFVFPFLIINTSSLFGYSWLSEHTNPKGLQGRLCIPSAAGVKLLSNPQELPPYTGPSCRSSELWDAFRSGRPSNYFVAMWETSRFPLDLPSLPTLAWIGQVFRIVQCQWTLNCHSDDSKHLSTPKSEITWDAD